MIELDAWGGIGDMPPRLSIAEAVLVRDALTAAIERRLND